MRLAPIAASAAIALLGGCTPYAETYSYSVRSVPAAPYAYPPATYYAEPVYAAPYGAPYAVPGPTVVVGGERRYYDDRRYPDRRFDDRNRESYRERGRGDEGYRGAPPGRAYGQGQDRGGSRLPPAPVAAPRPAPGPGPGFANGPSPTAHDPSFNPANPTATGGPDR